MSEAEQAIAPRLADVKIDDKYTQGSGRIYLSGIQALVRLPILQYERDKAAGLRTGGFISGYRGSPLGMYDHALWRAKSHLAAHNIHFQPGLNEDLAATSVWGSQQVGMFPGANVDGAFGIWYGKGPGVDRSVDVLKHANSAGTSKHGGVLAFAGDDHGCQSSTLAHQSEQIYAAALMPIINPSNVQDYLDLGLMGFALSRFSGCWVGFKTIAETVESAASIHTDPDRIKIVVPEFDMPPGGLNIRWPDAPLAQEARLHGPKMAAVAAFARANQLDRIVIDGKPARFGVITTGKAYLDVRQALADLGISDAIAESMGLRVYKVALTWPLEEEGARRFADGLKDVLVVEEKRGFIEDQLVRILYNMPADRRPNVVGKRDESGATLLPSTGELSPTMVARAIVQRLKRLGPIDQALDQRVARLESFEALESAPSATRTPRTPYFCSGCPHNTSTKIPDGSRAMAGIGCHGMALSIPARRTATITHMGGEGANWIGQAPFTDEPHVFQNLGDGTYTHSGLLALRASAASGVNITYKILYNDAVAMTGGQPAESGFTVSQIAHQVAAEGAKKLAIVSDEPEKYPPSGYFPAGATVHHRRDLDAVQRDLRETKGLSVLIYDQTCAAEKRRRRKRGLFPDPQKRAFINDLVCESCGDCSEKSNCVSVKPLETEFGRKRQIDQSNCNKDYSCVEGFCPSFVTVNGGRLRKVEKAKADSAGAFAELPEPKQKPLTEPYGILITGIGGTGVITIGALLGMAAHVEGKGCTTLDFTGLSQKNGAVLSHVRLAPAPDDLAAVRIAAGGADLLIGCDMIVSAQANALSRLEHGVTKAVINGDLQPTAGFVQNPDIDFATAHMQKGLRDAIGEDSLDIIDATGLATTLMGDAIATNPFMMGFAWQKGLIPLSQAALFRAIELNGAAIDMNKEAFNWGRLAAHDPKRVNEAIRSLAAPEPEEETFEQTQARRLAFLTDYQNADWAARYARLVETTAQAEKAKIRNSTALTEAVADSFFKLMSYKDEYEVARLYTNGAFRKKLERQFDGDYTLTFHMAPPFAARRDPDSGHLQKTTFGPWMLSLMRVIARMKSLRGGALDLFGRTAERRMERALIGEYEQTMAEVLSMISQQNLPAAVAIAALPQAMRGFGHIKEANVARARADGKRLMAEFRAPPPAMKTAAE